MSRTDLDTWEARQTKRRRALPKDGVASVAKLEAAKQALALVSEIPDIVELIDNAEAVRAAAKAKHISAEGINAWTRFVVDAERKAWARLKAMDGQLAKHRRPKGSELKTLSDLDEGLTKQRTHEWSMLAKLTEGQLDRIERVANDEDRIVTRRELLMLSKAGEPSPPPKAEMESAEPIQMREKAKAIAAEIEKATKHEIQIDDDAKVNATPRGAWVEAWLWVEDELARSDLDD
jgi:hypothetical protein